MEVDIRMKDIAGYEGLYAITSCGQVWSYGANKFLKRFENNRGYLRVKLCNNKKQQQLFVHRLVAEAYIPNPENLPKVDHIDRNRKNPCINNLRWCDDYTNACNRENSKPVFDLETARVYCSMRMAHRETSKSVKKIKNDCKKYREKGVHKRFIFADDVNERDIFECYKKHPELLWTDTEAI